jgi:hypothetical protein
MSKPTPPIASSFHDDFGAGALNVVFAPQCGQSTTSPIPASGNSMCAPQA